MYRTTELRITGRFLIGILAVALAGCSVAPREAIVDPVDLPGAFSDSGREPLPDRWWQAFEDPALDALIARAVAENFTLRSVWDRFFQAEQEAIRAGARLLPEVDYHGSARRIRRQTPREGEYSTDYAVGLSASYEVDLWNRLGSLEEAAALDARAAREDITAAAVTLSAAVAKTWYQLAEVVLQDQLIAEQAAINQQVLEIITLQFRQGQVEASNVFRQRQLIEATEGQRIRVQQQKALLEHQLAILVGRVPGDWAPEMPTGLPALPALPAAGVPSDLLLRRPDLRRGANAIAAADARVYAAVADQYPRLGLTASAETGAAGIGDLFDDWAGTLAATIVGPLLDGNRRRAEVRRTEAVLSERVNTYAQQVLTAVAEVEDALQQEHHQLRTIANVDRQLDLAEQVYERTRESYLKGRLDYLRVLDALVSRQTLQRDALTAQRLLIEHRIDLYRSLAGGWELSPPASAAADPETHTFSEDQQ